MKVTVNNDPSYYKYNYSDDTAEFPPQDKISSLIDQIRNTPNPKDNPELACDFGLYEISKGYIPLKYPLINSVLIGSSKNIASGNSNSRDASMISSLHALISGQFEYTLREVNGLIEYSHALVDTEDELLCLPITELEVISTAAEYSGNKIYLGAKALEEIFKRLNLEDARLDVVSKHKVFKELRNEEDFLIYVDKGQPTPEGYVNLINRVFIKDIEQCYYNLKQYKRPVTDFILKTIQKGNEYSSYIDYLRTELISEKSIQFAMNVTKERLDRLILRKVVTVPVGMIAVHPEFNKNPLIMLYKNIIAGARGLEQINNDKLLTEVILFRSRLEAIVKIQKYVDVLFFSELVENSNKQFEKAKGLIELMNHKGGIIRREVLGKKDSNMARNVISPAPDLPFNKIRIPISSAKQTFDIHLVSQGYDLNNPEQVKQGLRKIVKEVPVIFNRQPTLHRISIQGFWAELNEDPSASNVEMPVEVTDAYNADFDGDQMVTNIPVMPEAVEEVKNYIIANNNVLKPRDGSISTLIKHETIYGIFVATKDIIGYTPKNISVDINRLNDLEYILEVINQGTAIWDKVSYQSKSVNLGTAIIHQVLKGFIAETGVVNTNLDTMVDAILSEPITGSKLKKILNIIFQDFSVSFNRKVDTYHLFLQKLAQIGYRAAALCPPSVDLEYPKEMIDAIKENQEAEAKYHVLYEQGLITEDQLLMVSLDDENYSKSNEALFNEFKERGDREYGILNLIEAGAKCSRLNFELLYGLKGPIAVEGMGTLRVNSNYLNGLDPIEHCMSSMGTMPQMMMKTLEPANTGYDMRGMQHITSDTIIRSDDCHTETKTLISMRTIIIMFEIDVSNKPDAAIDTFAKLIFGRYNGEKYIDYTMSRTIAKEAYAKYEAYMKGEDTDEGTYEIRTLKDCKDHYCAKCYGKMTTTWADAKIGDRIGSIASPSIGEIGTQATMKVFQQGGKTRANRKTETFKNILSQIKKHSYDSSSTNAFVLNEGIATVKDDVVYIDGKMTMLNPKRIVEGRYYRKNSLAYDKGFVTAEMIEDLDIDVRIDYLTMLILSFFVSSDLSMKHIECLIQTLYGYRITSNPTEHPRYRVGKILSKHDMIKVYEEGIPLEVKPDLFKFNTFIKEANSPLLPLAFERIKEAIQGFLFVDEVLLDTSYGRRLFGRGPGR